MILATWEFNKKLFNECITVNVTILETLKSIYKMLLSIRNNILFIDFVLPKLALIYFNDFRFISFYSRNLFK
jgi:hypothetical protein